MNRNSSLIIYGTPFCQLDSLHWKLDFSGIGGFVAKPRQRGPPKPVVQGPVTEDGQPPVLIKELPPPSELDLSGEGLPADPAASATKKKIVKKVRKKGVIEDTYPVYLQVRK